MSGFATVAMLNHIVVLVLLDVSNVSQVLKFNHESTQLVRRIKSLNSYYAFNK